MPRSARTWLSLAARLIRKAQRARDAGRQDEAAHALAQNDYRRVVDIAKEVSGDQKRGAAASCQRLVRDDGTSATDPAAIGEVFRSKLGNLARDVAPVDADSRARQQASTQARTLVATADQTAKNGRHGYVEECLAEGLGDLPAHIPESAIQAAAIAWGEPTDECPESFEPLLEAEDPEGLYVCMPILEIAFALKSMKKKRAPGIDGVPTELLQAGGPQLMLAIAELLNAAYARCDVPDDWRETLACPIYKGQKSGPSSDWAAYRIISLLPRPALLLERVLQLRLSRFLEARASAQLHSGGGAAGAVISEMQGGCRCTRRTTDCSAVLAEVIKSRGRAKRRTFAAFLDCKKAFASMHVPSMLVSAAAMGIGGRMLAYLAHSYENLKTRVRVGASTSETFDVSNGLREGCILSPLVWAVFLNPLIEALNAQGLGIQIGDREGNPIQIGALAYVDDLALLAPSASALQKALDVATAMAAKLQLTWSTGLRGKSAVVVFGAVHDERLSDWTLGGQSIPQLSQYDYLGITFHRALGVDTHPPDAEDDPDFSDDVAPAIYDADEELVGKRWKDGYTDANSAWQVNDVAVCSDGELAGRVVAFYYKVRLHTPSSGTRDFRIPMAQDVRIGDEFEHSSIAWVHQQIAGTTPPWQGHVERIYTRANAKMGKLRQSQGDSGGMPAPVSDFLYRAWIEPVLSFGEEICCTAGSARLASLQAAAAKRILGVSSRTINDGALELMGWARIGDKRKASLVKYARYVNQLEDERLVSRVWRAATVDQTKRDNMRPLASWCEGLMKKDPWSKIPLDGPKGSVRKLAKAAAMSETLGAFGEGSRKEPKADVLGRAAPEPLGHMAPYLHQRLPDDLNAGREEKTRCLLGTIRLHVDMMRATGHPRDQRTCLCCQQGEVEDPFHFLIGCSSRADLTRALRDDLAEHDETDEDMFLRVMSPEYDDADESRVLYRHIAACRAHRDSVDPSDNSATAARAHPARSELRNDSDD